MKLDKLLQEDQLDEISFKHALAGGLIAGSMMSPAKGTVNADSKVVKPVQAPIVIPQEKQISPEHKKLADKISSDFNINNNLAEDIVELAHKYEKPTFPKAKDILAIIGTESSFNPKSISRLKHDKALGLMQIRPKIWGINPAELSDIENQIKYGSDILHLYYTKLKDKSSAIQAYNVGIKNFKNGIGNLDYLNTYHNELERYKHI